MPLKCPKSGFHCIDMHVKLNYEEIDFLMSLNDTRTPIECLLKCQDYEKCTKWTFSYVKQDISECKLLKAFSDKQRDVSNY